MAQKLILSVNEGSIQLQDLTSFVDRCRKFQFGPRQEISVSKGVDDTFNFVVDIPEASRVHGVRIVAKPSTKVQEAVAQQIEDRKTAVAAGEVVPGHVAPLVKTTIKKGLCPVCGSEKPLTRQGTIRNHTIAGKKCQGSGSLAAPVVKKKAVSKRARVGLSQQEVGKKMVEMEAGDKAVAEVTAKRLAADKAEDARKHKDEGFSHDRVVSIPAVKMSASEAAMAATDGGRKKPRVITGRQRRRASRKAK